MRGHVRHRGVTVDGRDRWQVQVDAGRDLDGRRVTRSRTVVGTRRDADTECARMVAELAGRRAASSDSPLGQFFDEWLEVRRGQVSHQSWKADRVRVGQLRALHRIPLKDLDVRAVDQALLRLASRFSPNTVRGVRGTLRMALADAVTWGLLPSNPCDELPRRKRRKAADGVAEARVPTDRQVDLVLSTVEGRWVPFFRLLAWTGMRVGEVCALRWGAVDLAGGVVRVEETLTSSPSGGKERAGRTKTGESRLVSLDDGTVAVVREWRSHLAGLALSMVAPEAPVFTAPLRLGEPLSTNTAGTFWWGRRAGLGLERVTLHGFRHWHASWLLRHGVAVNVVAARLGHSPQMTLRLYGRWVPAGDRTAVDAVERARRVP